jgi:antitoxin component YwqK of YwqJK toxin-antitoxin module
MDKLTEYRKKIYEVNSTNYVYTLCKNYLIILKRLPWAETTEESDGYWGKNLTYSIFRGSEFYVCAIEHLKLDNPELFPLNTEPEILDEIEQQKSPFIGKYHPHRIYKTKSCVSGKVINGGWMNLCFDGGHNLGDLIPFSLTKINILSWLPDSIYEKAKYTGTLKRYFSDGTIKNEYPYVDGKLHGQVLEYYETDDETMKKKKDIFYVNGKKHGIENEYRVSARSDKHSIEWKNGVMNGPYYIDKYFCGGEFQMEKGVYKNGERHGKFVVKNWKKQTFMNEYDNGILVGRYLGNTICPIEVFELFDENPCAESHLKDIKKEKVRLEKGSKDLDTFDLHREYPKKKFPRSSSFDDLRKSTM